MKKGEKISEIISGGNLLHFEFTAFSNARNAGSFLVSVPPMQHRNKRVWTDKTGGARWGDSSMQEGDGDERGNEENNTHLANSATLDSKSFQNSSVYGENLQYYASSDGC